jgi:uncharacterized alpha/beta hydrolase family protein
MFEKMKFYFILAVTLILLILLIPWQNIMGYVKFEFIKKSDLNLNFNFVNPNVQTLTADSTNSLFLHLDVRDSTGTLIPKAHIIFSVDNKLGTIYPSNTRTDKYGECIVKYIPPDNDNNIFKDGKITAHLNAQISSSNIKASLSVKLAPVPVVLVHGYQSDEAVFTNLIDFLTTQGFSCTALKYTSEDGIKKGATVLGDFLKLQKSNYLSQGIQVNRFNVVAHSMGGLVTRYYSCGKDYIKSNNINKIIFISVPQKGSPLATIGEAYFMDQGIKDLVPENPIFTKDLPSLINKGLNNSIQVGSLLSENDEVVSQESSSLEEWNIKTEVFAVGDSKLTINNILNGNFTEATNHMGIISNKKVFEKVKDMLNSKLPYPKIKTQ